MSIIQTLILIIACTVKMISIQIPNFIIMLILHTAIYQLTGISVYNTLRKIN